MTTSLGINGSPRTMSFKVFGLEFVLNIGQLAGSSLLIVTRPVGSGKSYQWFTEFLDFKTCCGRNDGFIRVADFSNDPFKSYSFACVTVGFLCMNGGMSFNSSRY